MILMALVEESNRLQGIAYAAEHVTERAQWLFLALVSHFFILASIGVHLTLR
jgi:hypothetical protein